MIERNNHLGDSLATPFRKKYANRVIFCSAAYTGGYNEETGWEIKLSPTERNGLGDDYCYVYVFPDFVTTKDGKILELEKIEKHHNQDDKVVVVHWNVGLERYYTGPIELIYFPRHSYEFLCNIRDARSEWIDSINNTVRTKPWQCLNGTTRPSRIRLAYAMQEMFGQSGVLSLGDLIEIEDWPYTTYRGTENEDNWMRLLPIYSTVKTNVVSETQYENCPGIITEKTLMAVLALQVPILIGYPGIVDDFESLGFDSFSDIVDHSYDRMPDDLRMRNAIKRNQDVILGNYDYQSLRKRLLANQQYVLDVWPEKLLSDYLANVDKILR